MGESKGEAVGVPCTRSHRMNDTVTESGLTESGLTVSDLLIGNSLIDLYSLIQPLFIVSFLWRRCWKANSEQNRWGLCPQNSQWSEDEIIVWWGSKTAVQAAQLLRKISGPNGQSESTLEKANTSNYWLFAGPANQVPAGLLIRVAGSQKSQSLTPPSVFGFVAHCFLQLGYPEFKYHICHLPGHIILEVNCSEPQFPYL